MVKTIKCIATGPVLGVTSHSIDHLTQGKCYDLIKENDLYYTFNDDLGNKRTAYKQRFVVVAQPIITGYITKFLLPGVEARSFGKLIEGWVYFGETDDTTYSQEFCSSHAGWFEPVKEQDNIVLYLGSKNIRIVIGKNGVICNDKKIDVEVLRAIVANSKSSSFSVGGYPIIYVTPEHRGFRIGCISEDNRFSIDDMDLVIKTYDEFNK